MVEVERKMMDEDMTKRYRLLAYLRTKKARAAVTSLMTATMTGQRLGSREEPDCWKKVVMKKTMVETPVH